MPNQNQSGFADVEERRHYRDVPEYPRYRYGPREATGTLVNSFCMSAGGAAAYALEELASTSNEPLFGSPAGSITSAVSLGILFRVIAYFLRNGGSNFVGEVVTVCWDKVSSKFNKTEENGNDG